VITLLHHSRSVGGVCRLVAEQAPGRIKVVRDEDYIPAEDDMVIRWDSVRSAKGSLELQFKDAVKLCRNKAEARKALGDLAPITWFNLRDVELLPAVVRPNKHYAGHNFNIVRSVPELVEATKRCKKGWYASPVLDKASEYRVYVFQGFVLSVSKRICDQPEQIAWNVALGARMVRISRAKWPINVVKAGINAAKALGLQWAAIDIAVTKQGQVVVFEANTAPGLSRNARSLPNIAKAFTWAGDNPDWYDEPKMGGTTYKSFLHPALRKAD
jgi:glutathione synthase/RimK-type ligase-like ATP-grasp enzyme